MSQLLGKDIDVSAKGELNGGVSMAKTVKGNVFGNVSFAHPISNPALDGGSGGIR